MYKVDEFGYYKINEDILKEYYDDLLKLCDWIPSIITRYLPVDIIMMLGEEVEDDDLYTKRIINHRIKKEVSDKNLEAMINEDVLEFLNKYPKFEPIFEKA